MKTKAEQLAKEVGLHIAREFMRELNRETKPGEVDGFTGGLSPSFIDQNPSYKGLPYYVESLILTDFWHGKRFLTVFVLATEKQDQSNKSLVRIERIGERETVEVIPTE